MVSKKSLLIGGLIGLGIGIAFSIMTAIPMLAMKGQYSQHISSNQILISSMGIITFFIILGLVGSFVYNIIKKSQEKEEKSIQKNIQKEIPESIKVISVFTYVVGGLSLLFILALVLIHFTTGKIENPSRSLDIFNNSIIQNPIFLSILIVLFLFLAGLSFYAGKNLKRGKRNGRNLTIAIHFFWLISTIALGYSGWGSSSRFTLPVVPILVLYYLIFNKKTKQFFNKPV